MRQKKEKIICGIQPTGNITLGNFLGVQSNILDFQDDNYLILFVANLHSLTTNVITPEELKKATNNVLINYLASGIDYKKITLFVQSDIIETLTLSHILLCESKIGELSRMTQYKDKVHIKKMANNTESIPTGLLTYPTLMAADILLYNANRVLVGEDQKQHLELAKNLAMRFNKKYGNTFVIPEILFNKNTKRIMDLQNPFIKMSKSNPVETGVIKMDEPIVKSINKIKKAKTDSFNKIKYDPEKQPGISNLINIYFGLINSSIGKSLKMNNNINSINEIENKYKNSDYGKFKNDLILILKKILTIYQEKINFFKDKSELEKIRKYGAMKANKHIRGKIYEIKEKVGLI